MKYRLYLALSILPLLASSYAIANTAPSSQKISHTDTQSLTSLVIPPDWESISPQPLSDNDNREIVTLLQNTHKFALNTWYNDKKKFSLQSESLLDFGGTHEHKIRPVSHQVFALAVSLKWNIYDPDITKQSQEEALAKTLRMIGSLAHNHKANLGDKGWGNAWQSALWASQTALAAWFLWDELPPETQEKITKMTIYEADRFLNFPTPYYKNIKGEILTPGDSKSEENAWNSTILVAATLMMPKHPHWAQWNNKGIELMISGHSAPGDEKSDLVLNGFPLKSLKGSNIEENGTIINHNIVHPDYMTAIMGSATNTWLYALVNQPAPLACTFNGERIYLALTDTPTKNGKTMYTLSEGKPTIAINYPQGNDWGTDRQANFWLMDVMADLFQWDKKSSVKGNQWKIPRQHEMILKQSRSGTGEYYQTKSEDLFASREEWISYHLAWGYIGLWAHKNKRMQFTERPITPRTL